MKATAILAFTATALETPVVHTFDDAGARLGTYEDENVFFQNAGAEVRMRPFEGAAAGAGVSLNAKGGVCGKFVDLKGVFGDEGADLTMFVKPTEVNDEITSWLLYPATLGGNKLTYGGDTAAEDIDSALVSFTTPAGMYPTICQPVYDEEDELFLLINDRPNRITYYTYSEFFGFRAMGAHDFPDGEISPYVVHVGDNVFFILTGSVSGKVYGRMGKFTLGELIVDEKVWLLETGDTREATPFMVGEDLMYVSRVETGAENFEQWTLPRKLEIGTEPEFSIESYGESVLNGMAHCALTTDSTQTLKSGESVRIALDGENCGWQMTTGYYSVVDLRVKVIDMDGTVNLSLENDVNENVLLSFGLRPEEPTPEPSSTSTTSTSDHVVEALAEEDPISVVHHVTLTRPVGGVWPEPAQYGVEYDFVKSETDSGFEMRILLDTAMLEVFVDESAVILTSALPSATPYRRATLTVDGEATIYSITTRYLEPVNQVNDLGGSVAAAISIIAAILVWLI